MDIVGPLDYENSEGKYIATLIDVFSKKAEASLLYSKDKVSVLNFLQKVCQKNGVPKSILTDNGLEFKNSEIENFCKKENIILKHGAPYNPTTQGCVKRLNQSLINKLKKLSEFGKIPWCKILNSAVESYNNSFSRAIGCTPNELYGKFLHLDIDDKYHAKLVKNINELKSRALLTTNKYHKEYDKINKTDTNILKVYDRVWYADPQAQKNKLSSKWTKTGTIVEKMYESYKVLLDDNKLVVANQKLVKRIV